METKTKDPFFTKLLKRFYGIVELDEYREKELNRINSQAMMLVWWYTIFANLIFLAILSKNPEVAAWTMLTSNLIIFSFVVPSYILFQAKKLDLTVTEAAPEDVDVLRKKSLKATILASIGFSAFMAILIPLYSWWEKGGDLISRILNPFQLLVWVVGGICFGRFMWIFARSNIQKAENPPRKARKFALLIELVIWMILIFLVGGILGWMQAKGGKLF